MTEVWETLIWSNPTNKETIRPISVVKWFDQPFTVNLVRTFVSWPRFFAPLSAMSYLPLGSAPAIRLQSSFWPRLKSHLKTWLDLESAPKLTHMAAGRSFKGCRSSHSLCRFPCHLFFIIMDTQQYFQYVLAFSDINC